LAHVITGSMRDSIYLNAGQGDSTYSTDVATSRADNRRVVIEAEVPPPTQRPGVVVGVAAMHGYYEEIRRAHKFLLPAAESVWPAYVQDCSKNIVY
jgi:hypothetical protein